MVCATLPTPSSTGLSSILFSTKSVEMNDPEGPENITTLQRSMGRRFTAATQALDIGCCEVIKSGDGEIPQDHQSQIENGRLGFIESVHQ